MTIFSKCILNKTSLCINILIITSNYVLAGTDTSDTRRQHIVEFGTFWNRLEKEGETVSDKKHLDGLLFDDSFNKSWDDNYGGLIYGFDPEGNWCDDDKYFWVQAESFAAAALLYKATDNSKYLEHYQSLWKYSWQHFVDHQHGAWFRVLHRDNSKYSNEKSAAGAKCDYHTLGACFEVIKLL